VAAQAESGSEQQQAESGSEQQLEHD